MKNSSEVLITSFFPKWFLWLIFISWVGSNLLFVIGIVVFVSNDQEIYTKYLIVFLLIFLGGIWMSGFVFSKATAQAEGLYLDNPFKQREFVAWENIIEIRKPQLKIPYDFIYVISRSGKKITLIKSMKNFKQLLEVIQTKAKNINHDR